MIARKSITVAELSQAVKNCLHIQFPGVCVEGEARDIYMDKNLLIFSLCSGGSKIKCILTVMLNDNLKFSDGDKVTVIGSGSIYGKSGEVQILVSKVEVIEKRNQLISDSLKKQLYSESDSKPVKRLERNSLIRCVAIITSSDGAALTDVLSVIREELTYLHVKVFPTRMQGSGAISSLRDSIELLQDHSDIDILIITRGGGSYQDLSVFNSIEIRDLMNAINVPVLAAIGHAKDDLLINHIAQFSATTPTSAIQQIVLNKNKFQVRLQRLTYDLRDVMHKILDDRKYALENVSRSLRIPAEKIGEYAKRLKMVEGELRNSLKALMVARQKRLVKLESTLSTTKKNYERLSIQPRVYKRGRKKVLERGSGLKPDQLLTIEFKDTIISAKVLSK